MKFLTVKKILPFLFIFCLSGTTLKTIETFEPIAVIELFSSQGCSSCPPADALLSRTLAKRGQNVIGLSFHVDYWDRLGWKDPFSDNKFSERQQNYARKMNLNSCYTPQMVVNGIKEFVGSDELKLNSALNKVLAEKQKLAFKNTTITTSGSQPVLHYQLQGDSKNAYLRVAVISLKKVTSVERGENAGATLVNEHVVKQFISNDAQHEGDVS